MGQFFFHYTAKDHFMRVVDGDAYGKTGLIPLRRVVRLGLAEAFSLPAKAENGAVFGLLEPQPPSWMEHEYHKGEGLLETIIKDIQMRGDEMLLLKCRVEPDDDIYVADHVFHMRADYNGMDDWQKPVTAQVKQDYWNSFTPFNAYKGGYAVPEVVSFSPVPLERISVVKSYDTTHELLNELRQGVGKPLLPPRVKPDLSFQAESLANILKL